MKYARKMKLVDVNYTAEQPSVEDKLRNVSVVPPSHDSSSTENKNNDAISFLDRHMKTILESTNLSDFDKWTQYNQALTRYLHWFKEKNNEEKVNSKLKKLIEIFRKDTENNHTNEDTKEKSFIVDTDSDDNFDYINVNRKRKRSTIDIPRKRVKSDITRKQKILKNQKSKLNFFKNWTSNI